MAVALGLLNRPDFVFGSRISPRQREHSGFLLAGSPANVLYGQAIKV